VPRFRCHLPTRFVTVLEVEAADSKEALKLIRAEAAEYRDSIFVEHLYDELDAECLDVQIDGEWSPLVGEDI